MSNVIDMRTRRPIVADALEAPRPGECLACFVRRMVPGAGCTGGLLWVERWRFVRARRATALSGRLRRRGAVCDCAVVRRVWTVSTALWEPDPFSGDLIEPVAIPTCPGVRPNSTQPCEQWVDTHGRAM